MILTLLTGGDAVEAKPLVSLIVPAYNEEAVIEETYKRLKNVMEQGGYDFEILIVDDGSTDRTPEKVKKICLNDKRVKLIRFSRNFGHQVAISAGIDRAVGKVAVIIDADLQDPPEVIPGMIEKWSTGYEVVYGVRKKRKGESLFKRVTAALFYRLLRQMTPIEIPLDAGDFRLLDRKVLEELKKMPERRRFVRGMVSWVGFRQTSVEYVREKRFAGTTKYPLRKMINFAIDGILSFSTVPLRISSALGFLSAAVSFLMMMYGLIVRIFYPSRVMTGWASLFVAVLFIGGIQLICIGILGEYLGRVYEETKKRPLYIVAELLNFD